MDAIDILYVGNEDSSDPDYYLPEQRDKPRNCIKRSADEKLAVSTYSNYNDKIVTSEARSFFGTISAIKKPSRSEQIKAWWSGTVLNIDYVNKSFNVELVDLNKTKIYDSIEFSDIADEEIPADVLFVGATFAFYVTKISKAGSIEWNTKIEFNMPYVWKDSDTDRLKQVFSSLFPEDDPLSDEELI